MVAATSPAFSLFVDLVKLLLKIDMFFYGLLLFVAVCTLPFCDTVEFNRVDLTASYALLALAFTALAFGFVKLGEWVATHVEISVH